jgi:hypothetical protein
MANCTQFMLLESAVLTITILLVKLKPSILKNLLDPRKIS